MNRRILWLLISVIVFISSLYLLMTGSPLLEFSLSKTSYLPLGNLTTWMGTIALPLLVFWSCGGLRKPDTALRKTLSFVLKTVIVLALLWAPVCYLLAGNAGFNFSEQEGFQGGQTAMKLFWGYSFGVPIVSLAVWIAYGFSLLFRRMGRNL